MSTRLFTVMLVVLGLAAAGCSTCVKVEGTYGEVWKATREALMSDPEIAAANPVGRYDEGTIHAVVNRTTHELHFNATIRPVGGDGPKERKVCVQVREVDVYVRELDRVVTDASTGQAQRRPDIETMICRRIKRVFAPVETETGGDPGGRPADRTSE